MSTHLTSAPGEPTASFSEHIPSKSATSDLFGQHSVKDGSSDSTCRDGPTPVGRFHQGNLATGGALQTVSRKEMRARLRQAMSGREPFELTTPLPCYELSDSVEMNARETSYIKEARDSAVRQSISNITTVFQNAKSNGIPIRIQWHQFGFKLMRLVTEEQLTKASRQSSIRFGIEQNAVTDNQDIFANKLLDALVNFNRSNDFLVIYSVVCTHFEQSCGYQKFDVEQHIFDCVTEQLKRLSDPSYLESQLLNFAKQAYTALDCKNIANRLGDVDVKTKNQVIQLMPIVGCLQKAGVNDVTSAKSVDDLTDDLIPYLPTNAKLTLEKAQFLIPPKLLGVNISDEDKIIIAFQKLITDKYKELLKINHKPEHTSSKALDIDSPGPIGLLLLSIKLVIQEHVDQSANNSNYFEAAIINALMHVAVKKREYQLYDPISKLSQQIMHEPQLKNKGFSKLTLMYILQQDLLSTPTLVVRRPSSSSKPALHQTIPSPVSLQALQFNNVDPKMKYYEYQSALAQIYPTLVTIITQDPCTVFDALKPLNFFPPNLDRRISNIYAADDDKARTILSSIDSQMSIKPWSTLVKLIRALEERKSTPLFDQLYETYVKATNALERKNF